MKTIYLFFIPKYKNQQNKLLEEKNLEKISMVN